MLNDPFSDAIFSRGSSQLLVNIAMHTRIYEKKERHVKEMCTQSDELKFKFVRNGDNIILF